MKKQEFEIRKTIELSDLTLEENREMDIYIEKCNKLIRIVNVSGQIAIFIKGKEDVLIKEWEGILPYNKAIRDIEDSIEDI